MNSPNRLAYALFDLSFVITNQQALMWLNGKPPAQIFRSGRPGRRSCSTEQIERSGCMAA